MVESTVKVSMQEDNNLDCSYAIISKGKISIIIILKDMECAVFDYNSLKAEKFTYRYLLLKHYISRACAYKDVECNSKFHFPFPKIEFSLAEIPFPSIMFPDGSCSRKGVLYV